MVRSLILGASFKQHPNSIKSPISLSHEEVETRIVACFENIVELQHEAPKLHWRHRLWHVSLAKVHRNIEVVVEIIWISHNKSKQHQQQ